MEASAGMTSLICAFARAHHAAVPGPRVFDDPLAACTRQEMAALLTKRGFLPAEQLGFDDITRQFFAAYNAAHPEAPMSAFENVEYVRAVRR